MIKDKPSEIITDRLCLRSIMDEDRDAVCCLLTNEIVEMTYMLPEFKSAEEIIGLFFRLKELSSINSRFVYGVALNGKIIGIINDVYICGEEIELGFAFHPDYHNKGYATETLDAAIKFLFDMGYSIVKTGAFECNLASQRVMQKAGMHRLDSNEKIDYRGVVHKCIMFEKRAK